MNFPYPCELFNARFDLINPEHFTHQQVIIGDRASREYFQNQINDFSEDGSAADSLAKITPNTAIAWLTNEGLETFRKQHTTLEVISAHEYGLSEAEFQAAKTSITLAVIEDCDPDDADLYLCTVPADANWELPAYLFVDAGNDILIPHIHCALHQRWAQEYGSKIVCVTESMLECIVSNPPSTDEAALALAIEHALYSPDIIETMGSVERLAFHLKNNKQWFFWWD